MTRVENFRRLSSRDFTIKTEIENNIPGRQKMDHWAESAANIEEKYHKLKAYRRDEIRPNSYFLLMDK